ncbi:MAG: hypothetical protein K2X93_04570 [Candidatus Obscuribacterales bacterium]|nr:hypothetical protein [Candidatus Obscuribacterales bacterium]
MEQLPQLPFLLITVAIASAIAIYAAAASDGREKFLCADCRFNNDEDCLKAERPRAIACTSYRAADALAAIARTSNGVTE